LIDGPQHQEGQEQVRVALQIKEDIANFARLRALTAGDLLVWLDGDVFVGRRRALDPEKFVEA